MTEGIPYSVWSACAIPPKSLRSVDSVQPHENHQLRSRAGKDELSVVSLFSGAGGFDHGFRMDGNRLLLANELREPPAKSLEQHFRGPDVESWETPASPSPKDLPLVVQGDVVDLDLSGLKGLEPDVLIGGPPCQEFSVMNGQKRRGIEVEGGRLYRYFTAAIAAMSPRVFVFENVHGLVSANRREAYRRIEKHLSDPQGFLEERADRSPSDLGIDRSGPGYTILHDGIVDAPDLGIPQTRRRLIMIGVRNDIVDEMGVFRRESFRERLRHKLNGGDHLFWAYPLTALEVFEGEVITNLQDEYRQIMEKYRSLPESLSDHPPAAEWVRKNIEDRSLDVVRNYARVNGISPNLFGEAELEEAMEEHANVLESLGYRGSPVREVEPGDDSSVVPKVGQSVVERMWRTPPGENYKFTENTDWEVVGSGLSLIYRRPDPLRPAPTVVANGGGGTFGYHYDRDRNELTNRERARLQTFRDSFLFEGTSVQMRRQIGEAVPPLLARRVAEEVHSILPE